VSEEPSEFQAEEHLRAFARKVLKSDLDFHNVSWETGGALVWRITASSGERFFLKRHETELRFELDTRAQEDWIPLLPEAERQMTVRLVGISQELRATIVIEVPGEMVLSARPSFEERLAVNRAAGAFAKVLHSIPFEDDDPLNYGEYAATRLEQILEKTAPYVDIDLIRWARKTFDGGSAFGDVRRVPCHRDYSQRNWIIDRADGGLKFGVIDWERARSDYWLYDAHRMVAGSWERDPALKDAFFDGYGRQLSDIEERRLLLLALVDVVGAISWAIAHNDREFELQSRRRVEYLRRVL
jgi:hypothetical protein